MTHSSFLMICSYFNNFKENDVSYYNYKNYQEPKQLKNMENDYKIKYVAPFLNAAFDINDKLAIYW